MFVCRLSGFIRLVAAEHFEPFLSFWVGLGTGPFPPLRDATLCSCAPRNYIKAAIASDIQIVC